MTEVRENRKPPAKILPYRPHLYETRKQNARPAVQKPKILDLFCCAGGAGVGYWQVGFDVVGVDIRPQQSYPFPFIQADALTLDLEFVASFDAIHASPPCQAYSDLAKRNRNADDWPRLVEPVREMLRMTGRPYVIENVDGAPLLNAIVLCGTMFPELRLLRHRLYEAYFQILPPPFASVEVGGRTPQLDLNIGGLSGNSHSSGSLLLAA
jgi:hypothetical protein